MTVRFQLLNTLGINIVDLPGLSANPPPPPSPTYTLLSQAALIHYKASTTHLRVSLSLMSSFLGLNDGREKRESREP